MAKIVKGIAAFSLAATVILAMGAGKTAARAIDHALMPEREA